MLTGMPRSDSEGSSMRDGRWHARWDSLTQGKGRHSDIKTKARGMKEYRLYCTHDA